MIFFNVFFFLFLWKQGKDIGTDRFDILFPTTVSLVSWKDNEEVLPRDIEKRCFRGERLDTTPTANLRDPHDSPFCFLLDRETPIEREF